MTSPFSTIVAYLMQYRAHGFASRRGFEMGSLVPSQIPYTPSSIRQSAAVISLSIFLSLSISPRENSCSKLSVPMSAMCIGILDRSPPASSRDFLSASPSKNSTSPSISARLTRSSCWKAAISCGVRELFFLERAAFFFAATFFTFLGGDVLLALGLAAVAFFALVFFTVAFLAFFLAAFFTSVFFTAAFLAFFLAAFFALGLAVFFFAAFTFFFTFFATSKPFTNKISYIHFLFIPHHLYV